MVEGALQDALLSALYSAADVSFCRLIQLGSNEWGSHLRLLHARLIGLRLLLGIRRLDGLSSECLALFACW